ncbi:flagellar hook-basal body complex protein FliE [Bythopirellula polymerisocia]|uniref:Flagellar hook-basal body complex protein FliE n=1 Tax=Bythopirellula polymerisocia TaxID=2528003 RepID=A0A5C6CW85_9BACT|nr:flagellar hook-basal body complex protein FliE [Bythopirellula polymerisocia]TWU27797.1 flagellar hook-basal body protein FliE [Bythopirellula polymerisocia]
MSSITPSQLFTQQALPQTVKPPVQGESTASFKDFLLDSIRDVNSMQQQADQAVETMMTGGEADPAEVLTAVQKADLAFRLMMQMRNKMMQVYQEVKEIRV